MYINTSSENLTKSAKIAAFWRVLTQSPVASRRVNEIMIIFPQRADQTIDGTIVCETGVIANLFAERVPLSPPNKETRIRAALLLI